MVLWMARAKPRRAKLSREFIAEQAVALVDAEGLEALSMRALGRACGVQAMSLYRYVQNKDDLLDAMQEAIVAQMREVEATEDWRSGIDAIARELRRVLAAHPRAILLFVRPAATDGSFAALGQAWTLLDEAGLSELDALRAVQSLLAFVVGQALWQFTAEVERQADDEFEFGLDLMLRGLAQRIEAAGA